MIICSLKIRHWPEGDSGFYLPWPGPGLSLTALSITGVFNGDINTKIPAGVLRAAEMAWNGSPIGRLRLKKESKATVWDRHESV